MGFSQKIKQLLGTLKSIETNDYKMMILEIIQIQILKMEIQMKNA